MKRFRTVALAMLAVVALTTLAGARQSAEKGSTTKKSPTEAKGSPTTGSQKPLVLSGSVPLEGVKGRFDHFAFGEGRVFVSALGITRLR